MEIGDMSIPWRKLPKSIRDGITVAANLSLHCLWIDSICIIQDDPADVTRELAQMSRIYSQATVTIAASRAETVEDGFLQPRQVNVEPGVSFDLPCSFKLPYRCPNGELGSIYLAPLKTTVPEPLDARAWAFQERMLSPRILEYGSRQVRWLCAHSDCQASCSDGWIPVSDEHRKESLLVDNAVPWTTIVGSYTRRKLALQTDRPLAIAGIAEAFHEHSHENDTYLAGLWSSSLATDLLWK
ncbi:hypothetical protein LSUE1_G010308, partial [Lachnellula suecica]